MDLETKLTASRALFRDIWEDGAWSDDEIRASLEYIYPGLSISDQQDILLIALNLAFVMHSCLTDTRDVASRTDDHTALVLDAFVLQHAWIKNDLAGSFYGKPRVSRFRSPEELRKLAPLRAIIGSWRQDEQTFSMELTTRLLDPELRLPGEGQQGRVSTPPSSPQG